MKMPWPKSPPIAVSRPTTGERFDPSAVFLGTIIALSIIVVHWFWIKFLECVGSSSSPASESSTANEEQPATVDEPSAHANPAALKEQATAVIAATPPEDGLPPESLLEHTAESFAAVVVQRLGRGDKLARALYRCYFLAPSSNPRELTLPQEVAASPVLGGRLLGLCDFKPPLTLAADAAPPAPGATEKYVLSCASGEEVEMVAMPAPGAEGSWSLCISSQVGCPNPDPNPDPNPNPNPDPNPNPNPNHGRCASRRRSAAAWGAPFARQERWASCATSPRPRSRARCTSRVTPSDCVSPM